MAPASKQDDFEIRATWTEYVRASNAGDGQGVRACVGEGGMGWFSRMRALSRSGSEDQVRALSLIERLFVVGIRELCMHVPNDLGMEAFVDILIAAGLQKSPIQMRIESVEAGDVDGLSAAAISDVGVPIPFVKEPSGWKFDLSSFSRDIGTTMKDAFGFSEKNIDKMAKDIAEETQEMRCLVPWVLKAFRYRAALERIDGLDLRATAFTPPDKAELVGGIVRAALADGP